MNDPDIYLLHRARNLAITLDEVNKPHEAELVTELIERLESVLQVQAPISPDNLLIEKVAFKQLLEASNLLTFWLDNVGRLSLHIFGDLKVGLEMKFILNPPGRRQQFLRQDVITALMNVRELLKTPQYG